MSTPLLTKTAQLGTFGFNYVDANGVECWLEDIDGWDSPASTLSPQQKPRGHGAWAGDAFLTARTIALTGKLLGADAASVAAAKDALIAAVTLDESLLTVTDGAGPRSAMVRRQDRVLAKPLNGAQTFYDWSAQVVALDPRKYGPAQTVTTGMPSTTGGLTLPLTIPFSINATTVSGIASIVNAGNIASPLKVRFDGPLTGPYLVHIQTGRVWAAATASLGAGEFWTVDMANHKVLAQGQASRSGYLTSRGWMELLPGQNDFQFGAASGSGSMTIYGASAWE